ncbi:MAG: glycosyltransferase [Candidatus Berkelbacteria bacterium]|nr:glycosyltransferase [Candidatus Berkelbacteria bacterium]
MIENISFIIIAKNEAFAVEKCLSSLESMALKNCEVICVDSDSADDTQAIMKSYALKIENLRVIECSGFINAAVARNVGMTYATKKFLFFVDGDIEIYPEFIVTALDRIRSGKADAVTGKLMEIQYTSDYKYEIRRLVRRKHMTKEKECLVTGGIFIATREIVEKIGAWDSDFVRLQDFEYTSRISRIGTLLQIPEFIGIHHTQEFYDRSWEYFRKGYPMFYGRLLRKNFDRLYFSIQLLRGNRGLATFLLFGFVLVIGLVAIVLSGFTILNVVLVGLFCISLDFLYSTLIKRRKFTQWILHNYLEPPLILFGMFQRPKCDEMQTHQNVII